jgi:hypothetical protein
MLAAGMKCAVLRSTCRQVPAAGKSNSKGDDMDLRMRKIGSIIVAVGLLAMAGCASVPMASAEQDQAGKAFVAKGGKARIYLYRNETFGAAVKMAVSFDGKTVGQTASKTYYFWDVDPGKHTVASLTENTPTLEVNAQSNGIYYVWQEVKMGAFAPRSSLQLVDEATGKKGVQECKLAQSQAF